MDLASRNSKKIFKSVASDLVLSYWLRWYEAARQDQYFLILGIDDLYGSKRS